MRGHTFPKGICPKVNVIAWLEFELAYSDSAVHCVNHNTTRTPPWLIKVKSMLIPINITISKNSFYRRRQFSCLWLIDRTLSGAITPDDSEPGSYANKRVLRVAQSCSITEATASDCLVSYPGYSLESFYSSVEVQSLYSAALTESASKKEVMFKQINYIYIYI